MKRMMLLFLLFGLFNVSCSVYQTMVNLGRLKFKLNTVNGFNVNGVLLNNKLKLSDFSAQEILAISSAVARGSLPVSFTLNIGAKNPNDGTGGYPRTNATITNFPWRLLIDNKETVKGNLANPFTVPGTGEEVNLPIQISLDVMKFFSDRNYESILNLLLAIGGRQGSSANLTVFSQPTVSTNIGNITYPREIKIVSVDYSN